MGKVGGELQNITKSTVVFISSDKSSGFGGDVIFHPLTPTTSLVTDRGLCPTFNAN